MATTTMTMAKALNEGLRRAMEKNPKVLLMGEDIGRLGGVLDAASPEDLGDSTTNQAVPMHRIHY